MGDAMEIRWAFRHFPAFVFYSDRLVRYAGLAFGPLVLLRRKYRGDASAAARGVIEHELTHVRQFYRTCGLNGPRYLFARWRLAYEVEAYRAELRYNPEAASVFAGYIAGRYRLDITQPEALKLLA